MPPKRTRLLTDPQSPAIKRCRIGSPASEKKNSSFVAAPVPKFDKVFKVEYPDRPLLIPRPFSFEERERNKKAQKEAGGVSEDRTLCVCVCVCVPFSMPRNLFFTYVILTRIFYSLRMR